MRALAVFVVTFSIVWCAAWAGVWCALYFGWRDFEDLLLFPAYLWDRIRGRA